ncbi:MAG: malonate decarboxylase acyl carrier protein [Nitrosomonadales bacterium]|nr:malonate decarboxylase acyl carrier protein [Nitrosomonadales bacterium]
MENLKYRFDNGTPIQGATAIVGVLGSGNLEVLVEPAALGGACEIEVQTAARGFGTIWQAVMKDFFARHRAGDIRISVNDAGATPAIVSLRLDQAIETYKGKVPKKDQP